jgi:hypothetical protein
MRIALASMLVAFTLGSIAFAKGPTIKLIVSGPGLASSLEIREARAIAPNLWGDDFYGAPTPAPDAAWPRYVVAFYAAAPEEGVSRRYVVTFVRDPKSGNAFVYFPGRGEEGYRLNVGTILRGIEGTWRTADRPWGDAIAAWLPRHPK